ncbi:hypothetical protein ACPCK1_17840 [Streptomyces pseudogriseolus]|uniref:hypothetical protein n=1 Tax=Streptomyces pseudogriseolus TaxID=36817 RepID=UPI003FA1B233
MTAYISECGYCHETQFTGWYSKSAPHDMYGRVDRDYGDGRPVAYCSEEHRDAADAQREASAAAAAALAELLMTPPAWLPPVDNWEMSEDDGAWVLSASLRGADVLDERRRYHLISRIAAGSKLPVEDDGRVVKARFVVDGVQASVWYLRPFERWIVPETCATRPTELGAPDVSFVRLGEGRDAPVVCVACRDRMHAAWIKRAAADCDVARGRAAAAEFLRQSTGSDLPEWRGTYTEYGVHHEPNAIAPVCTDPDHIESEDPTAFECCPEPIIDVGPALAEYLVALLNADREAGETA